MNLTIQQVSRIEHAYCDLFGEYPDHGLDWLSSPACQSIDDVYKAADGEILSAGLRDAILSVLEGV